MAFSSSTRRVISNTKLPQLAVKDWDIKELVAELNRRQDMRDYERWRRQGMYNAMPPPLTCAQGVAAINTPYLYKLAGEPEIPYKVLYNRYVMFVSNLAGVAAKHAKIALYLKPRELKYSSAEIMFEQIRDTATTLTLAIGGSTTGVTLTTPLEKIVEGELWIGIVWDAAPDNTLGAADGLILTTATSAYNAYSVANSGTYTLPVAIYGNGASATANPYIATTGIIHWMGIAYV